MTRIKVDIAEGAGYLTLARPDKRNALDRETADELTGAIARFESDQEVRVIVVRAEGKDFCAGADIHALRAMLDAPLEQHEADARALGDVFVALHASARPTVALVRGRAFAGGAALATACDMIIADDTALFSYPEVALGFVPAMAMAMLVRSVGEKIAFDLAATGRRIGAREALGIGLISRVVPAADYDRESAGIITALAGSSATALAATKSYMHHLRGLNLEQGIAEGARINARARLTEDFKKGVIRFADRKP